MVLEPKRSAAESRVLAQAERWLPCAIVAMACFLLVLFLYAALHRVRYPYEVEWIESGMMVAVLRILHGQPLYAAPTPDYVAYLYAPLYFYVAAAMAKITGPTLAALRAVSIISTLGSCAVIFSFVLTETRRAIAAVAAAGLFIGCYAMAAQFYDIGRVDSMFVFLLLLALFVQRRGHPIIAAMLWALTAQTKQTVLPLAVFILCAEWPRPRRLLAAVGTFLALTATAIALQNHATHGWYSFYVFHVAGGLPVLGRQAALFLPRQLFAPFGITVMLILAAIVIRLPALRTPRTSFYIFVTVALVGGTWFVASHDGASSNAYMPVYAWTAMLFGVALHRVLQHPDQRVTVLALAAALVQLAALTYNPGQYIPTPAVRAARASFIQQLSEVPGDVYMADHSYDAVLANKTTHAEIEALGAAINDDRSPSSKAVLQGFDGRLRSRDYSAVVVDSLTRGDAERVMRDGYALVVPAFAEDNFFLTSQPHYFLLPCTSDALARSMPHPGEIDAHRCKGTAPLADESTH